VAGMEVRIAVIVEEHRDRDPEEAADRWHGPMIPPAAVVTKRVPKYVPDSAVLARLNRTQLDEAEPVRPCLASRADLVMKGSPVRVRAAALGTRSHDVGI
jgi:hypothetical protein